jgi:hypothetical protein
MIYLSIFIKNNKNKNKAFLSQKSFFKLKAFLSPFFPGGFVIFFMPHQ